jgi:uncharacterized coiled-coil protein SlyX
MMLTFTNKKIEELNKQLEEEKAKVEEYLNWYDDTLEQLKESQNTVNKLKDLLNK